MDVLGHTFGVGDEYIYINLSTSTIAKRYLPRLRNLRGEFSNPTYNRLVNELSNTFDADFEENMDEDMDEADGDGEDGDEDDEFSLEELDN